MKNKNATIAVILLSSLILPGCVAVVAGGAAATGAAILHDRRSSGTILDDQTIEIKAYKIISDLKPKGDDIHVTAISYNNTLLLIGQTSSAELTNAIVYECQEIKRVKRVYNELSVMPSIDLKSRANDALITSRVKAEMTIQTKIDPTRVKIVTENGVVYLMGLVTRDEEEIAVETARSVDGVEKVVKVFEYRLMHAWVNQLLNKRLIE